MKICVLYTGSRLFTLLTSISFTCNEAMFFLGNSIAKFFAHHLLTDEVKYFLIHYKIVQPNIHAHFYKNHLF